MRIHLHLLLLAAFVVTGSHAAGQTRLLGADLSMLPVYEKAGAVYRDASGQTQADPLLFFRDKGGVRCVRLRLFVNPTGETGVVQDLDFVKTFARRIKAAGMKWMLDFHYSDTWADPSKQHLPQGWPTDPAGIEQTLCTYTAETLQSLVAEGAGPDYIQIGNEISYGLCDLKVNTGSDSNWSTFCSWLSAAARACREQCPDAKIIVHTERAGQWSTTRSFYERIASVDYDIIGLSYYPFWHNSLAVLSSTLTNLAATFPQKEVMIVEYAYNNAWTPGGATYDFSTQYPYTPDGQRAFTEALIAELRTHANVTGFFYWMPEENPAGNHVYEPWLNRGLFANGYASVGQANANCALPAFYSLSKFTEGQEDGVSAIGTDRRRRPAVYDLAGRTLTAHHHGIAVSQGHKAVMP